MGAKEDLLRELSLSDRTGLLSRAHLLIVSHGLKFKGPSNSKTLLYFSRDRKSQEVGIIAMRVTAQGAIFSLPKTYWSARPTQLRLIRSLLPETSEVERDRGVSNSQYSIAQFQISSQTFSKFEQIINDLIIPLARDDGLLPRPNETGSNTPGEATEGAVLLRTHIVKERSRSLVNAKLADVQRRDGQITCEGCACDLLALYGSLGVGAYEVHHLLPIGRRVEPTVTKLDDLAVLCPNCHSVVHRTDPMWSIDDLAAFLRRAS